MIPKFKGIIVDGKILVENEQQFINYIKTLENKPVDVVVKKHSKNRSYNQNRYYWGVIIKMIADETGNSPEDIHIEMKRFFASTPDPFNDGLLNYESTANMTTARFQEYQETIKRWASEFLNLYIPDPNEVDYENNKLFQK